MEMEKIVKGTADLSQPVPVSDDEDDGEENSQSTVGSQHSSFQRENSQPGNNFDRPIVDSPPTAAEENGGHSPQQDSVSSASTPPQSSPANGDNRNGEFVISAEENSANSVEDNIDNVSVENGGDEFAAASPQDEDQFNGSHTNGASIAAAIFSEPQAAGENFYDEHNADVENVSASPSGSPREDFVDDFSIAKEMNEYIKANRINWAEIEELQDLWAICDAISAAHSGLPDSLLKDAFLLVLQGHMARNKTVWIRQQLDYLTKMWKKEIQSEIPTERPTKFIAASADYVPQVVVKKRRTNANKRRALKGLMGVGDILQQARQKFATEEGELDVDEDEHGNISIGGQELSFETWGEINRIKDDDIVHSPIVLAKPKRQKTKATKRKASQLASADPSSQSRMSGVPGMTAPQAPVVFVAAGTSLPNDPSLVGGGTAIADKNEPQKSAKIEKDEGELSESDDEEDDDASDSASSPSSSDDDGGPQSAARVARHRRKKRRETERQKGQSSVANVNNVMQKFFQYRFQIAQSLTIQQKAAFLDLLKQSNGGPSGARLQQITQLMVNSIGGSMGAGPSR